MTKSNLEDGDLGMGDFKQTTKEVVKYLMLRCGLAHAVDAQRRWRGQSTGHLHAKSTAEVFSGIYSNHVWVKQKGQDSLSGEGSTKQATVELAARLSAFLKEVGCRKLVDIGCGDFNWMRTVEGDFSYLGIDVVPLLINGHNSSFADSRRSFLCLDATQEAVPSGDVALCREVLFHLSYKDGWKFLRNIQSAGFKHVLITNDKHLRFNTDIRTGDYRRINLLKPPFRFPAPTVELTDDKYEHGRVISVWPGPVFREIAIPKR